MSQVAKTYRVDNITCGHCVGTIERELSQLATVTSVSADKDTKQVRVQVSDPAALVEVESTLVEIGFEGTALS